VRVEERGKGVKARGLDDLGFGRGLERPGGGDLGDAAVAHEQVAGAVDPRSRIQEVGLADQRLRRR
jgi:hypothetical protein